MLPIITIIEESTYLIRHTSFSNIKDRLIGGHRQYPPVLDDLQHCRVVLDAQVVVHEEFCHRERDVDDGVHWVEFEILK